MNTNNAVLHICLSDGWGGLEMYPIRTGKALLEQNWQVLGLCLKGTRVAQGMKEAGMSIFEIDSKWDLFKKITKVNAWLKEHNTKLIHAHKSGDLVFAALLDTIASYRIIFTEHMGVTRPKKDLYHKWVYSHVDQILSISDETKARNLKALPVPADKIQRLWLGTEITPPITDTQLISNIRQELSIPTDAKVIGTLGRIGSGKGQLELLEAFIQLKANGEHPDVHLLIVGGLSKDEGSNEDVVQKLQSLTKQHQLEEFVHFSGFRRDTKNMLATMDIVAILSHNEAFGLTVIEAMAAGKLILGSNTGAIPEILGSDYPYIVNPLIKKDIADQLNGLITHRKCLSKIPIDLNKRAHQEFCVNMHITSLVTIYRTKQ
ncbi:glycosyltransferase family 4 protein [Photobacterium swingsii]|uniref:glycosyltransferase family 4 protein n=1 Tax=Photobacterium swingsii TaxID=680026 RepID=UPI004068181A